MAEPVYEAIVAELQQTELLKDFKYLKTKSKFVQESNGIRKEVELLHWCSWTYWLAVEPIFRVRFNILHKWFEKFCVRPIKYQRDDSSVGFSYRMMDSKNPQFVEFRRDGSDYSELFPPLKESIPKYAEHVFKTYSSLEDMYELRAKPLYTMENPKVTSYSALFNCLTLARILDPNNYEHMKEIMAKLAKQFAENREANMVLHYYPIYDEIIDYLESYDFKPELKKMGYKV